MAVVLLNKAPLDADGVVEVLQDQANGGRPQQQQNHWICEGRIPMTQPRCLDIIIKMYFLLKRYTNLLTAYCAIHLGLLGSRHQYIR